ncbi:hypothetical protein F3Y22_tig00113302pilonHSYRG00063 [Hibiscus syriacus]|uniref:Trans-cinnamate 4-monooxygenase n=1 Tax=Hibiscus syriacus TaxID=106335 RepID=A0A6A2X606_HIBSY|nr:hypothetical protein F3Y22_tig00113302pilonHSYRG00063 [Hibiscus syriacus]
MSWASHASISVHVYVLAIETTLWSIEWGIAELVNHPEIQQKLRDEIDTVLGHGVQVTEPDTHKLPYLQAVIKETLRLRMAIPLLVPHMNLHDEKLRGYDIPAESKILVNAWWLASNPAHWKNLEEFRPERFFRGGIEGRSKWERLQVSSIRFRRELPGDYYRTADPSYHVGTVEAPDPRDHVGTVEARHDRERRTVQLAHSEAFNYCCKATGVLMEVVFFENLDLMNLNTALLGKNL